MSTTPSRGWILALALLFGCGGAESVRVGDKLAFRLRTPEGGELRSASLAGDVVLLEIWATWCAPCHIQAEILAALGPELVERGVRVLSVNYGEEAATVRAFQSSRRSPFPVLLDERRELSDRVGIVGLPALLVLDRRGTLVAMREGLVSAEELRRMVRRAQDSPAT